jgi:LysM repeat protein
VRALLFGLFALVVATAVLLINRPAEAGTQVRPVPVSYHVVLPGETLLEIASTVDPGSDARDVAVRIARLNALDGWGLQSGQRLALPVDA